MPTIYTTRRNITVKESYTDIQEMLSDESADMLEFTEIVTLYSIDPNKKPSFAEKKIFISKKHIVEVSD